MSCSSTTESWKKSEISLKYPTFRDVALKSVHSWLAGKRVDDNAEGLWRIHDSIYDLSDFINRHPGGPSWLEQTKGTDITEAFETHHISRVPEKLLEKFKVRNASEPRNITLTFKDDGFYRTLKNRVREKIQHVDRTPIKRSDMIHSALLASTFLVAVESVAVQSNILVIIGGLLLCWTVISAHNYFHKRDNWRMYTFNLSFMSFRDWRVSHAMSHHLYTNSFNDLELSMFEPFFCWIPNPFIKNWTQRYLSWIYGPFVYTGIFVTQLVIRIAYTITKENILNWDDLIGLTLPMAMYIFSGKGIIDVIITWLAIETVGSFIFGVIGINAAHHHPELFHDGDTIRTDRDWGVYQVDSIADRSDLKGSQFLVLTHFGDHVLHHLFPTLDHGILPQLYPVLFQTMDDFKCHLKEYAWFDHIVGQLKQLSRITPNKIHTEEES